MLQCRTVGGDGDLEDDETVYEIDKVVSAERIGNRYKVWIKWKDYDDITWMWKHELVKQSSNTELLNEIDKAVAVARDEHRRRFGHHDDDDNEVGGDDRDVNAATANDPTEMETLDPNTDVVDNRPIAQRATRSHRRKELILACSDFRISDALRYMSVLAHESLCSFMATADTLL